MSIENPIDVDSCPEHVKRHVVCVALWVSVGRQHSSSLRGKQNIVQARVACCSIVGPKLKSNSIIGPCKGLQAVRSFKCYLQTCFSFFSTARFPR